VSQRRGVSTNLAWLFSTPNGFRSEGGYQASLPLSCKTVVTVDQGENSSSATWRASSENRTLPLHYYRLVRGRWQSQ
jgi:hypothetical protein